MTMPVPVPTTDSGLPEPDYDFPIVTLVITNQILPKEPPKPKQASCPHCQGAITLPAPDKSDKEEPKPIFWMLSKPHPLVPALQIVRMRVRNGVVYIFAVSGDGQTCIIDQIPQSATRLVEKGMRFEVFREELEVADAWPDDSEDPDDEPDDPAEPEPAPGEQVQPAVAIPNGTT